jgi:hypothetical protein
MKLQEITFKRPIRIFQVFRNINVYGKANKSFDDRKDRMTWKVIPSKSGHVIDGELYLPEQILKNADLLTCDLITIEDDNQPQTFTSSDLRFTKVIGSNYEPDFNHCFHLARHNKLDIFEIRKEDEIELHLQYGYFEIGIPERKNFKLCDIKKNKPVEIKINGKTDFSLSSGRERIFKEQDYIFEYIGDFDKCKILKEPYGAILKSVPADRKVIDLNKGLW